MPANQLDLAMIVIRGAVLIIAAAGAVISIFLGWKLYRDGVVSSVSASLSDDKKRKAAIVAAGPGIFFALFGMILLVYLVRQPFEAESTVPITINQTDVKGGASSLDFHANSPSTAIVRLISDTDNNNRKCDCDLTAKERDKSNKYCVVAVVRRRLYTGNPLTKDRIDSGLSRARFILQQDRDRQSSIDFKIADETAIQTINEIINSPGYWDL